MPGKASLFSGKSVSAGSRFDLAAARDVIYANHAFFEEKPEALRRTIKEMYTPRSGITPANRRAVFKLLCRQIKKDNHHSRRFAKQLGGHRELVLCAPSIKSEQLHA